MASYPTSIVSLTNPAGNGSQANNPDHAALHTSVNQEVIAIETTLGTTSGTSVIKNIPVGKFAVSDNGGTANNLTLNTPGVTAMQATTGTLTAFLVTQGTFTGTPIIGTPSITGGTHNQGVFAGTPTIGTPAITGGTHASAAFTSGTFDVPIVTGGLSLSVNGSITQSSTAAHITLTPGASKLVRSAVLEQDNSGTNNYVNNIAVLTGWGTIASGNSANPSKSVTFGINFTAVPTVIVTYAGTGTSYPSTAGNYTTKAYCHTTGQGTSGFTIQFQRGDGGTFASSIELFSWTAIGPIA